MLSIRRTRIANAQLALFVCFGCSPGVASTPQSGATLHTGVRHLSSIAVILDGVGGACLDRKDLTHFEEQ